MRCPAALVRPALMAVLLSAPAACRRALPPSPEQGGLAEPVAPAPPGPVAPLTPGARTEDERNTIAVFRDAWPSVVFVTERRVVIDYLAGVAEEVPAASGSGYVWDTAGHIVTNYHVIKDAQGVTVSFEQHTFDAKLVGVEPRKDIAVLAVDAPPNLLKPVRVPHHATLEVGQKVLAIGNPFGLDHSLTVGIVSALGRQVQGIAGVTIRDMIQTDAAINPGNSGGPLLDSAGQIIGMNTMIFSKSGSSAGVGFAVPISTIARVVPQLIKNGKVEQLGIGVEIDPAQRLERRLGLRGVIVLGLQAGGPAEKAGLHGIAQTPRGLTIGDVIEGIDAAKVDDYDDLYNALDAHKAGDEVEVKVRRGDGQVRLKVAVIALP